MRQRLTAAGLQVLAVELGEAADEAPHVDGANLPRIVRVAGDVRAALALFRAPANGNETELILDKAGDVRARWTSTNLPDLDTLVAVTARIARAAVAAPSRCAYFRAPRSSARWRPTPSSARGSLPRASRTTPSCWLRSRTRVSVLGHTHLLKQRAIAMVGARNASHARIVPATLQDCAMQPPGRNGGSPSKISPILPRPPALTVRPRGSSKACAASRF